MYLYLDHAIFSSDSVKDYLEEYFQQSQRALRESVDENLYLLCIQCFEVIDLSAMILAHNNIIAIAIYFKDALNKQHSGKPFEHRIEVTIDILENSHGILRRYQSNPVVGIRYLEGIAGMRFALMEAATLLHLMFHETFPRHQQQLAFQLIQTTQDICTDHNINTSDFTVDAVGPALYLLKLLVRQYGFNFLKQVSAEYQWIVPAGLRTGNQVLALVHV